MNQIMHEVRHRASSAGRDQFPAGPLLPLAKDQGPRGTMIQDGPKPEGIIAQSPALPKFYRTPDIICVASFAMPPKSFRGQLFTKSETNESPENTRNNEKHAPRKSPRKLYQTKTKTEPADPRNL